MITHLPHFAGSSEKIDRAIENPSSSLQSVSDKTKEFDYLQRQKESIDKVDQLIEEAEQSLQELRREFYQTEEEIAKGGSRSSIGKRPVKSDRSLGATPTTIASKGITEKKSVKSKRSVQSADELGSKRVSAKSSARTDRTSIIEQPIGTTVDLTTSKDAGRESIRSKRSSFVQQPVASIAASKGSITKTPSLSQSPSTRQHSMDDTAPPRTSVPSTPKRSVEAEHPIDIAAPVIVSKETARTLVPSNHLTMTQPTGIAQGTNDSKKTLKSDPTSFAQRLIENAANITASKDTTRKSPTQSVTHPVSFTASSAVTKESQNTSGAIASKGSTKRSSIQSAPESRGFSVTESKGTAGGRSMRSNIPSSLQQPIGVIADVNASRGSTIKESIRSFPDKPSIFSKTSSSKPTTLSGYPSMQRQQASISSKESGGIKSSIHSNPPSVQQSIPTDVTTSKASTLASGRREPRDVTTSKASTAASELTGVTDGSFKQFFEEQPMNIPTTTSMSTEHTVRQSIQQSLLSGTTEASVLKEGNGSSIVGSKVEDVPSKRLSKTSRKSAISQKSSGEKKYDPIPNDRGKGEEIYIDDSVKIRVFSQDTTESEREQRPSRFSILKHSIDYGIENEPAEIIKPTPVDEKRFLSTKNSIFLKMVSASDLSDDDEDEAVDSGSRVVKIVETPPLNEFHTESSIILQAQELNLSLMATVEKEDSISKISSANKEVEVSNIGSDIGLVGVAETREEPQDTGKHGSECCPCDKNKKSDDKQISSKKSSRSSGKESGTPKTGSVRSYLVEKASGRSGNSSKTPERSSRNSRGSSDQSLTISAEQVVNEQVNYESLTEATCNERTERGINASPEKSWDSIGKLPDPARSQSTGKSTEIATNVEEDITSKKCLRKPRDRSHMRKTSTRTKNEKVDELSASVKCPKGKEVDIGDERVLCDRTTCRDKSCGPSKKEGSPMKASPTRSPPAKSHVIPCHVPCRGEVYMQSLSPKIAREFKTRQAGKTRKKKTSSDRSRELGSARKRSDEKFDGDDEDTSVDEKASKRSTPSKTSPPAKMQTAEAALLKECCLTDNHQVCCPCTKGSTTEVSVTTSAEMMMPAPTTPDPEYQLLKLAGSAEEIATPDPTPRPPEPTSSETETSVDNEEGSCSCRAELEALNEFGTCEPCGNTMKLTPALKSPLSPRKPPSVCKRTAFCTECQIIPPAQPEFLSEVARIARGAGIFEKQPMESTSTETDVDDSHLMTISERTETTSIAAAENKQLTIQHLPQIDIRPPLVVQKVFEIEIKSTGSVSKQIPTIDNVGYEEIMHAGTSAEELPSVILDEFLKNKDVYKVVSGETSVKVIEPNISIKNERSSPFSKKPSFPPSTAENGEKKSCLKEYDYDNPMIMKTIKSNVSFKNEDVSVLNSEGSKADGKSVSETTESKSTEKGADEKEAEAGEETKKENEEDKEPEVVEEGKEENEENKEPEVVEEGKEENEENKEPEVVEEGKEENEENKEPAATEEMKEKNEENQENVEKKTDEIPKPAELKRESSAIIKDIKQGTLQHMDSTLMLVSPAHSTGVSVKVAKSKDFTDVMEVNTDPSSNVEEMTNCGCDKESGSHISEELEVDETLNEICDCCDASLKELDNHISAETNKSLQEIEHMETVLNKLVSDKALAESDHTDDYKLLDSHKYEAENGDQDEEPEENAEKEGDKQEPEHANLELQPVYQADSENPSIANHKFEEDEPVEDDKPNENAVTEETQEPKEVNETDDTVPKEPVKEEKSMKSVKSEKGTPLFTEDPNFRTNHKGVPKSVSQYFSSTDMSIDDDEEQSERNTKSAMRQRLSMLSDPIRRPPASLQSEDDKNNYDAVDGVLQILQVQPKDQPLTSEECNCQCRLQQSATPLAMMVASHTASVPVSPKSSTKAIKKLLTPSSSTRSSPKSFKIEEQPSENGSPVNSANDAISLTPSIMKGRRSDPSPRVPLNPSAIARKTSFNLVNRVVLPGTESNDNPHDVESEESIYVVTHDVSVQVSLDSLAPRTSSSSVARAEKKLPRVKISVQDGANDKPPSNNYWKRKQKVKSKDQYQQSQGNTAETENQEETNSTDVTQDTEKESSDVTQDTSKEFTEDTQDTERECTEDTQDTERECTEDTQDSKKECIDATPETEEDPNDLPSQTVVLQPVIVHYETKGVQKSLEDWCCPPVKLRKLRRCNDLENSSTSDNTDTDRSSFKNAPFGDMPTVPEFMSYSPIRRPDTQRENDELSSLGGCRNTRAFKSPKHCYSTSSSDTVDSRLEETLSEGEIKCRCSVSIGELHICRLAKDIKARAAYLKKHPEVLVKREYPGEDVRLMKKRTFYDNWVAVYASKVPATATSSSSDTGDRSTET